LQAHLHEALLSQASSQPLLQLPQVDVSQPLDALLLQEGPQHVCDGGQLLWQNLWLLLQHLLWLLLWVWLDQTLLPACTISIAHGGSGWPLSTWTPTGGSVPLFFAYHFQL
jgi:hypothetical protein